MRMPAAILGPITAFALGVAMNPSFAQASPQAMHPGDPGYDLLLEAATTPLREALGDRVELDVERMDRIGEWAFVLGSLRAPGGGRPDYADTRFAEAASQGAMSDVYVALLRREHDEPMTAGEDAARMAEAAGSGQPDAADTSAAPAETAAQDQAGLQPGGSRPPVDATVFPAGGRWRVLDHAIGPGDVAWLEWPREHAAPRALFGF